MAVPLGLDHCEILLLVFIGVVVIVIIWVVRDGLINRPNSMGGEGTDDFGILGSVDSMSCQENCGSGY